MSRMGLIALVFCAALTMGCQGESEPPVGSSGGYEPLPEAAAPTVGLEPMLEATPAMEATPVGDDVAMEDIPASGGYDPTPTPAP